MSSVKHRVTIPVLVAGLFAAQVAEAQTVSGRVLEVRSGRAVADAIVRLVDRAGAPRAVAVADAEGRYELTAPEPGGYRVRAEQLGYEIATSRSVELLAGADPVTVDVTMTPAPLPIEGIEVSTDR